MGPFLTTEPFLNLIFMLQLASDNKVNVTISREEGEREREYVKKEDERDEEIKCCKMSLSLFKSYRQIIESQTKKKVYNEERERKKNI
jgi:hypothetical protein